MLTLCVDWTRRKAGCGSVVVDVDREWPDPGISGHLSYAKSIAREIVAEAIIAGHVDDHEAVLDAWWVGLLDEPESIVLSFLTLDDEGCVHACVAYPEGG